MIHPWKLQDLTFGQLRKRRFEVAVLPMGALEPHNLHLPYGTDTLQVEAVGERSCEAATKKGAKVVLLPPIPYGSNRSTMKFPLVINLDHATLFAILKDVIESLEVHRILKFVILNGHGGNHFREFMKDIFGRTKVFISVINWWEVGAKERSKIFEQEGEHGDEMETSMMLHLYPHLVRMKAAGRGSARQSKLTGVNEGWVKIVRPWHLATVDSGYGDPRKATAEKGKRYLDLTVGKIAGYLVELSKAPFSSTFPY